MTAAARMTWERTLCWICTPRTLAQRWVKCTHNAQCRQLLLQLTELSRPRSVNGTDALQSVGVGTAASRQPTKPTLLSLLLLQAVLLKVYELNCWKLYTATQAEADLNLELAGVAPTRTITLQAPADPMIRCVRRLHTLGCCINARAAASQ